MIDDGDGSTDPGPLWPWAAPLGDHGRAAAVLALAALSLQHRGATVSKDRPAGRLTAFPGPGTADDRGAPTHRSDTLVIMLDHLAVELAEEPIHRWPQLVDCYVDAALEAADRVGRIRVGRWEEARHRLLVRVVRCDDGGPLHRPIGCGLSFDVGIGAVPGAHLNDSRVPHPPSIVVGSDLIARWGRSAAEVHRTAAANTRRLVRPEPITPSGADRRSGRNAGSGRIAGSDPGRVAVVVLHGGPWTAGVLIDPLHFLACAGRPAAPHRCDLWVSALDPTAVMVIGAAPDGHRQVGRLVDAWFDRRRHGFPRNLQLVERRDRAGPAGAWQIGC